jgi:branched-chain amino acid transport system permease protein
MLTRQRQLLCAAVAALILSYPLLTASTPVYQRLGALVLLSAIGASAWNLVGGYGGQVSVGHAVFFGAGAYAAIAAYSRFELPPIAGIPLGVLIAVLIAALIGMPTLRLSGHYFSMATIAVAELVRVLVSNWDWVGGAQGISGPAVPRTFLDLSFTSALPYYCIFLAVLAAILLATWRIETSRMGFYLRAIKDSERAARSLGVAAGRYKLYAYMLSAGLIALDGSLYALMFGFVDPESGFGILIFVKMLIMVALGGSGLLFGPLVGALILVPLEEISNSLLGGKGAGLTFVVYGAIIVVIARFLPSGILAVFKSGRSVKGKPARSGRPHAA